MGVLEAFVHDPLINWRLVHGGRQVEGRTAGEAGPGGATRPRGDETNLADGEPSDFYSRSLEAVADAPIFFNAEYEVEQINARALEVIERVQKKLTGRDFKPTVILNVDDQVDKLIAQATSNENLSASFVGWCRESFSAFCVSVNCGLIPHCTHSFLVIWGL